MITGIDVWEGSLDINESIILEAGVKFVFIRLNDMNGGHHPDANFTTEWEQCESFLRAPYFVYNPWVSGKVNAEFLLDTIPTEEVTKVMDDIEVVKKDYPAADYAREVANYYLITSRYRYTHVLYTGQWFLGNLSYWPTNVDYCWARYPNYLYPDGRIEITWADLNTRLVTYGWNPDPQKRCPKRMAVLC
jgi:GH25 family lysozyme M1 (1,4-beta-N-acetylmuramidase)